MSVPPELAAAACLAGFAAVSFIDEIVLHLVRERLPFRSESRLEHALHTMRSLLFPFILVTFFGGTAATTGLVLLGVDQVVELADMAVERRSRAFSGGLRSSEYLVHGILLTLRAAAVAFTLVAGVPSGGTGWLSLASVVNLLVPGAVAAAILHVVLLIAPGRMGRFREGATS
jgi:hypothetical protein